MPIRRNSGQDLIVLGLTIAAAVFVAIVILSIIRVDIFGSAKFPELPYSPISYGIVNYEFKLTETGDQILVEADPEGDGYYQVFAADARSLITCVSEPEQSWRVTHDPETQLPTLFVLPAGTC